MLQNLSDHCGQFTYMDTRAPVNDLDTRILKIQAYFLQRKRVLLLPGPLWTWMGLAISPVIVQDPVNSLLPWVMQHFTGFLDRRKELFNCTLICKWHQHVYVEGWKGNRRAGCHLWQQGSILHEHVESRGASFYIYVQPEKLPLHTAETHQGHKVRCHMLLLRT